ncbi:MAG: metallophosphoesterase family protein [Planctomycetota bacterium]
MRRIAILSDTHGLLRPEVVDGIQGVEQILHIGDVGKLAILDELHAIAPVTAVCGNVDDPSTLPLTAVADCFGKSAYLIHILDQLDLDPAEAGFDYVFFGHSHKPDDFTRDGVRYVNPGSIGPRRFDLPISYAVLDERGDLFFHRVTPA